MDPNDEFDEASEEGWVAEQRRTVADYFVTRASNMAISATVLRGTCIPHPVIMQENQ
jgi:hypothetical protein